MGKKDPKQVVLQFNDCINKRDLRGLTKLMSEDHTFIDSDGGIHSEKKLMIKEWENFFKQYPDYRNHFWITESRGDLVIALGQSTCSFKPLDGPAIWTAKVTDGFVTEWRVYPDTVENREKLKI